MPSSPIQTTYIKWSIKKIKRERDVCVRSVGCLCEREAFVCDVFKVCERGMYE